MTSRWGRVRRLLNVHTHPFGAYQIAAKREPNLLKLWLGSGQRKVVVKIEDEPSLFEVQKKAVKLGLITNVIHDAGHTQVAPNTITVLGVGPGMPIY